MPTDCKVNIYVAKASGLADVDGGLSGKSDPFVTMKYLVHKKGLTVLETKPQDNNQNPQWSREEAERTVEILSDDADGGHVIFELWDDDTFGKDPLGSVTIPVSKILAQDKSIMGYQTHRVVPPADAKEGVNYGSLDVEISGYTPIMNAAATIEKSKEAVVPPSLPKQPTESQSYAARYGQTEGGGSSASSSSSISPAPATAAAVGVTTTESQQYANRYSSTQQQDEGKPSPAATTAQTESQAYATRYGSTELTSSADPTAVSEETKKYQTYYQDTTGSSHVPAAAVAAGADHEESSSQGVIDTVKDFFFGSSEASSSSSSSSVPPPLTTQLDRAIARQRQLEEEIRLGDDLYDTNAPLSELESEQQQQAGDSNTIKQCFENTERIRQGRVWMVQQDLRRRLQVFYTHFRKIEEKPNIHNSEHKTVSLSSLGMGMGGKNGKGKGSDGEASDIDAHIDQLLGLYHGEEDGLVRDLASKYYPHVYPRGHHHHHHQSAAAAAGANSNSTSQEEKKGEEGDKGNGENGGNGPWSNATAYSELLQAFEVEMRALGPPPFPAVVAGTDASRALFCGNPADDDDPVYRVIDGDMNSYYNYNNNNIHNGDGGGDAARYDETSSSSATGGGQQLMTAFARLIHLPKDGGEEGGAGGEADAASARGVAVGGTDSHMMGRPMFVPPREQTESEANGGLWWHRGSSTSTQNNKKKTTSDQNNNNTKNNKKKTFTVQNLLFDNIDSTIHDDYQQTTRSNKQQQSASSPTTTTTTITVTNTRSNTKTTLKGKKQAYIGSPRPPVKGGQQNNNKLSTKEAGIIAVRNMRAAGTDHTTQTAVAGGDNKENNKKISPPPLFSPQTLIGTVGTSQLTTTASSRLNNMARSHSKAAAVAAELQELSGGPGSGSPRHESRRGVVASAAIDNDTLSVMDSDAEVIRQAALSKLKENIAMNTKNGADAAGGNLLAQEEAILAARGRASELERSKKAAALAAAMQEAEEALYQEQLLAAAVEEQEEHAKSHYYALIQAEEEEKARLAEDRSAALLHLQGEQENQLVVLGRGRIANAKQTTKTQTTPDNNDATGTVSIRRSSNNNKSPLSPSKKLPSWDAHYKRKQQLLSSDQSVIKQALYSTEDPNSNVDQTFSVKMHYLQQREYLKQQNKVDQLLEHEEALNNDGLYNNSATHSSPAVEVESKKKKTNKNKNTNTTLVIGSPSRSQSQMHQHQHQHQHNNQDPLFMGSVSSGSPMNGSSSSIHRSGSLTGSLQSGMNGHNGSGSTTADPRSASAIIVGGGSVSSPHNHNTHSNNLSPVHLSPVGSPAREDYQQFEFNNMHYDTMFSTARSPSHHGHHGATLSPGPGGGAGFVSVGRPPRSLSPYSTNNMMNSMVSTSNRATPTYLPPALDNVNSTMMNTTMNTTMNASSSTQQQFNASSAAVMTPEDDFVDANAVYYEYDHDITILAD